MPFAIGVTVASWLMAAGAAPLLVTAALVAIPPLVNIAIGVGINLLTSALLPRPRTALPGPSDGQAQIRQALSPRVVGFGQIRVSGTVWWFQAVNPSGGQGVLYLGLALNHGRIAEFLSFHIDDNEVDIDGADKVTTAPYATDNVFLHHRFGLPGETKYSELLTAFGMDQVRGDGVATILAQIENPVTSANFQNRYPNGAQVRVRATIKAQVVWKFRDAASQRLVEPTHAWSDNPIECLLFVMLSPDGYAVPWEMIEPNLAEWIEAADVCDELVDLADGGSTKRYRIAGQYRLTDDPVDVVAKLLTSCDGRVWPKRDGTVGVVAGKFLRPRVTIGNAEIVAYTEMMRGQDPVASIEGVRAQFMSPDHDYREHEAEPWPSGAAVLDLSEERTATLDLLWSPSISQARRLMKREFLRAHAGWRGTIHTTLAGLRAMDERFVNVEIDELGIAQPFEVARFALDPNTCTCELEILAVDDAIDEWNAITEEGTEEAVFAFVDSFTKTGTTIDPLLEAGGVIGKTAYIFAANTSGFPAVPSGYQSIFAPTPAGGLAIRGIRKRLDGTESAVSVNSVSGAIIVMLMQAMPNPAEVEVDADMTSGGNQAKDIATNAIVTPFAALQFAAVNNDYDNPVWMGMADQDKVEIAGDRTAIHRTGSLTAQAAVLVFGFDASPPTTIYCALTADPGAVGKASFIALPGA